MNVLLVTKSDDNESVDLVARALEARGARPLRFDTDLYPTEVRLSRRVSDAGGDGVLDLGHARVALSEIDAIWHRRLAIGDALPEGMDPQLRRASVDEARRVLLGTLAARDVFTLDRRVVLDRSSNKELQLDLARAVGLDVPATLISNDAEEVRTFAAERSGAIVTKMMTSFAVYEDGREQVVFTNPVSARDLEDLDGLALCPMTFQEHLEKVVELRVTIVGERVFAASIDSQRLASARHDWRREGIALIDAWREHELDADTERGLLELMDRLGLNYGAADIVVTPDGRQVFLEVNPVGEFFWLERQPGFPISDALADVLVGRSARRGDVTVGDRDAGRPPASHAEA